MNQSENDTGSHLSRLSRRAMLQCSGLGLLGFSFGDMAAGSAPLRAAQPGGAGSAGSLLPLNRFSQSVRTPSNGGVAITLDRAAHGAKMRVRPMNPLHELLNASQRLPGEWKAVRQVDERGQYQQDFPAEFPFEIKRIFYPASQPNRPLWHTYLEIFVLLSSECRRQMGDSILHLSRGDVLVMDHSKLHRVVDFPGDEAEAVVIRFLPEIVRSAGAATRDHALLLPFYCHVEDQPNLLRANDAATVHSALAQLIECYATPDHLDYCQTGSRAHFLVLLHRLARHFQAAERLKELFARQQTMVGRLYKVFEHINACYAEPISLPAMALKAGLSRQRFNMVFKKATGMTLVEYLTQVRLTHAARLLQETDRTVTEIANGLGFSDQSYFDRRFRRHFGRTPMQFRKGFCAAKT